MGEGGPPFKLSLPAFLVDRVETLSLAPPTGQKQQSSPRNASLSLADGESLLALAQSDSAPVGWRQIYGKDDIRIWERRVDGYKNKVYMGKALIKAEPETVADLFRTADVKTIQKYNPVYASGYDIAQVDANTKGPPRYNTGFPYQVSWASTKGIFPFQARDFVTTIQYDTQRNGTQLILNHAAEHPSCPPMPKSFVRAKILAGAQVRDATHLTCKTRSHSDPDSQTVTAFRRRASQDRQTQLVQRQILLLYSMSTWLGSCRLGS
eukprot:scaffold115_cov304-Prasinococcus_capsulatus_cf.AAC.42